MTDTANDHLRFRPLPLQNVTLDDHFWRPRLEVNRTATLLFLYRQLERVRALDALDLQPRPLRIPRHPGSAVTPQMWWDLDIADQPNAQNTFEEPERVSLVPLEVGRERDGTWGVLLPPHSLATVVFAAGGEGQAWPSCPRHGQLPDLFPGGPPSASRSEAAAPSRWPHSSAGPTAPPLSGARIAVFPSPLRVERDVQPGDQHWATHTPAVVKVLSRVQRGKAETSLPGPPRTSCGAEA